MFTYVWHLQQPYQQFWLKFGAGEQAGHHTVSIPVKQCLSRVIIVWYIEEDVFKLLSHLNMSATILKRCNIYSPAKKVYILSWSYSSFTVTVKLASQTKCKLTNKMISHLSKHYYQKHCGMFSFLLQHIPNTFNIIKTSKQMITLH